MLALERLIQYPKPIAQIDLGAVTAELDAILVRHGARSMTLPPGMLYIQRGTPFVAMATKAYEADRIARAVVSEVRAAPFFASVVVAVHPRAELEAPVLVVDLRVVPTGVTHAFLDTCGPSIARPRFGELFYRPLMQTLDAAVASAVRRKPVPSWIAPLSGGAGAQLRAGSRRGSAVAHAVVRYIERYLEGLDKADAALDAAANAAAAQRVRDAVRSHGAAGKYLARAFGSSFASRYLELLWNES